MFLNQGKSNDRVAFAVHVFGADDLQSSGFSRLFDGSETRPPSGEAGF